jgi:hypothetical protein
LPRRPGKNLAGIRARAGAQIALRSPFPCRFLPSYISSSLATDRSRHMLQNFSQHAPSGTRAPLSLRGFRLISSRGPFDACASIRQPCSSASRQVAELNARPGHSELARAELWTWGADHLAPKLRKEVLTRSSIYQVFNFSSSAWSFRTSFLSRLA